MKKIAVLGLMIFISLKAFSQDQKEEQFGQAFDQLVITQILSDFTLSKKNNLGIPDEVFVSKRDPFNGESYQNILVGDDQKLKWNEYSFGTITHYRYITLYNSKRNPEFRLTNFPAIQEECHDESWSFGEWSSEYNYSVTLTTGAGIKSEQLGLEASVSYAITHGAAFRTTRRLQGSRGHRAIHVPYGSTEDWQGVTYIQTYNSNTGEVGYLRSSLGDIIGNFLGANSYPWRFYLNNQNFIFKVKKTEEETCSGYEAKAPVKPPIPSKFVF